MKRYPTLSKSILFHLILFISIPLSIAQVPQPALIGYFHNWNTTNAPYVQLDQVDSRYNVIEVAFAVPQSGTDFQMTFSPNGVSKAQFISQIQSVQAQGKKVLISMGGGGTLVKLDDLVERDSFVNSMTRIVNTYGFDGIDMDFEGSSLAVSGGTISTPLEIPVILMIDAIKRIMEIHRLQHGKKLMLTMAPETAHVQGGQSAYSGARGTYLPIIDALRDSLDILQVQLYNSGTMYGIDRGIYSQGTADFLVAMTEATIQGFNTNGGFFAGLPASKIALGLPACPSAAGGGYTSPAQVQAALEYLLGYGPQPGSYQLRNASGYPDLRGMMTWSINWDASSSCTSAYEYAGVFDVVFGAPAGIGEIDWAQVKVFPNPTTDWLHISFEKSNEDVHIQLTNPGGQILLQRSSDHQQRIQFDMSALPAGMYYVKLSTNDQATFFKVIKI